MVVGRDALSILRHSLTIRPTYGFHLLSLFELGLKAVAISDVQHGSRCRNTTPIKDGRSVNLDMNNFPVFLYSSEPVFSIIPEFNESINHCHEIVVACTDRNGVG